MSGCYNQSMQSDVQTVDVDDRRDAPRVDVEGRYTMCLDPCDGRALLTCSLLDFSVTGVRLTIPEDVPLPEHVQIIIGEISHNARIVWRKGLTVGVDFIDEHHSIF